MNEYLGKLNDNTEPFHEEFEEMRAYALEHNVPIIKRDSLIVMNSIISAIRGKRMLEVGTAIAYSSLSFVTNNNDLIVDTLERNPEMIGLAKENIAKLNMNGRINIIEGDALELDTSNLPKYDIIFIDAAKAQYQKFFDKFSPLLSENGVIISDNIIFHGCVENTENLSKNVQNMVKKIDLYNHYLNEQQAYKTYYLETGDGLAITMRK